MLWPRLWAQHLGGCAQQKCFFAVHNLQNGVHNLGHNHKSLYLCPRLWSLRVPFLRLCPVFWRNYFGCVCFLEVVSTLSYSLTKSRRPNKLFHFTRDLAHIVFPKSRCLKKVYHLPRDLEHLVLTKLHRTKKSIPFGTWFGTYGVSQIT